MNLARTLVLFAAAALAATVFAPSAHAQYGGGGGGYGWGGGWPYNFQSGIFGRTNAYNLPYFSLQPPVYYSHVVPRPYGFSPFATPPGMIPAEMLVAPAPKMIENPHFNPEDKKPADEPTDAKPAAGRNTAAARAVVNPFYRTGPIRVAGLPE